jgi:GNAT superfamily N-acetyltransferase
LWLSPGVAPDEASLVKVIQDTVATERKDAMFSMFEQMDAYHPGQPHWHLPLIGVDPMSQGRGIGSALQRHILEQCDHQKMLAYLEATSPRNVPLYSMFKLAISNILIKAILLSIAITEYETLA